jgi:membrane-bound metal-dependent hydrolase YbcI (DUF457 family)
MPTPLGHSLAGLAVYLAARDTRPARQKLHAFGLVALANLPDIDFIPGYILGTPRAYHWGPTHSVTAALIVGCAAAAVARWTGTRFAPAFAVATLAYGSHIVLDMLLGTYSNAPSVGLQAFWPFTTERFMLPWAVFLSAPRDPISGPLGVLFSPAAVPLLARELLILGPVALVMSGLARVRRKDVSA